MKQETNDEVELLAQEIRAAFVDVPYPGDDNITDTTTFEDERISNYFRGTTQEGHTVRDLRAYSEALSFFSPAAYHYYLPAFVTADLTDSQAADTILSSLIIDFSSRLRPREIIPRLSRAQRQVMIRYFEYCIREYGDYHKGRIEYAINLLSADE